MEETRAIEIGCGKSLDRRFDREKIKAELSHGVLTLTIPKAEAVKPRRVEIAG